jgi:hypothetical protein
MGGLRVGSDFFERRGLLATSAERPRGVVNRVSDLANAQLDVARIHPAIVPFFEDTGALDLTIESRWRFPFSVAWWFGRLIMAALGQFVLPRGRARIATQVLALDRARDGRDDARGVIRTYVDSGDVMQVVAYATFEREGMRFMSAAFPLLFGHVAGFLRLDAIAEDDDGRLAVELTSTRRDDDDAGVWFVLRGLPVRIPFGESLRFWAPGMRGAPPDLDPTEVADTTIIARHEQRFLGIRLVTHDYWFCPAK